jgi:hypothetical protein
MFICQINMKVLPMNKFVGAIAKLIDGSYPFAVFFYPREKEPELVLQQKTSVRKLNSLNDLNNNKGFVFAPFFISNNHPLIIIDPDIHIKGYQSIASLQNSILSDKPSPPLPHKNGAPGYQQSGLHKIIK